jgi:heavy metal efflux system protein
MRRLRPFMVTELVACLRMLPAAISTGIGSDSQKPFATVIVGLISRLIAESSSLSIGA